MNTQTSQAALDALERTELVIASIRTQQPLVTAALHRIAGGVSFVFDWEALQEHHARLLERSAAALRRADQDHRHLLLQATDLRRHHRAVAARVKAHHRTLRSSVAGLHGEEALPVLGLGAPPERTFLALREQARELLVRLRDPALHLPPARHGQEPIRRLAIAAAIEPDVIALAAALEDLRRIEKRLDESLIHKHQALAAHHRVYLQIARIQEGYYHLARLDALADRIRGDRQRRPASPRCAAVDAPDPVEVPRDSSASDPLPQPPDNERHAEVRHAEVRHAEVPCDSQRGAPRASREEVVPQRGTLGRECQAIPAAPAELPPTEVPGDSSGPPSSRQYVAPPARNACAKRAFPSISPTPYLRTFDDLYR